MHEHIGNIIFVKEVKVTGECWSTKGKSSWISLSVEQIASEIKIIMIYTRERSYEYSVLVMLIQRRTVNKHCLMKVLHPMKRV